MNSLKKLTRRYWVAQPRIGYGLALLFGAMMGMISSLLVFQFGQARVWFAMSRDGLMPKLFGRSASALSDAGHRRPGLPVSSVGVPAGILDIGTLADLSNIGTLFAFVLVSIGVIILRFRDRGGHRGFPRARAAWRRRC